MMNQTLEMTLQMGRGIYFQVKVIDSLAECLVGSSALTLTSSLVF
jgi:hypothetical protein